MIGLMSMQVIHLDVHLALAAHSAGVCTAWYSMITTHYPDNDTTRMNQLSSWRTGKKTYTTNLGSDTNKEHVQMNRRWLKRAPPGTDLTKTVYSNLLYNKMSQWSRGAADLTVNSLQRLYTINPHLRHEFKDARMVDSDHRITGSKKNVKVIKCRGLFNEDTHKMVVVSKTVTPEVDTLQPEGGGLAKKAKFE